MLRGSPYGITATVVSPSGHLVAGVTLNGTVMLFDANDPNLKRVLIGHVHTDIATSVAFSPDGKKLGSGSCDSTIALWSTDNLTSIKIGRGHSGCVQSVDFSPDGKEIISCDSDGTILTAA